MATFRRFSLFFFLRPALPSAASVIATRLNLAFDKSGNLLVLSSAGAQDTVYTSRPGAPANITVISPEDARPRLGGRVVLPANYWKNGEFANRLDFETMTYTTLGHMFLRDLSAATAKQYVSADGSVFLPAARVFQQGRCTHGFLGAAPGDRVYVGNEPEDVTYRATVKPDSSLGGLAAMCTWQTDRSSSTIPRAPGQVESISPNGRSKSYLGGAGKRTLFVLAHQTLFAAQIPGS